jgi:AcrR family transcriptional regulator
MFFPVVSARRRNQDRSRETRGALLSAARLLFEERGYAGTTLEQVVSRAGVTRGALYHHFENKRDLFRAVLVEVQQELADHVDRAAEKHEDAWEAFVAGWLSFLDITPRAGIRRVLMLEGPAVLGYSEWREIDDRFFLDTVAKALENLMRRDVIAHQPVAPLARVLLTISNALGTLLAEAGDHAGSRDVMAIWAQLLGSLRAHDSRSSPQTSAQRRTARKER